MINRRALVDELHQDLSKMKRCLALKHLSTNMPTGLNRAQLEVMFHLSCSPSHTASIKQLMNITQTTSSAVTQLVETLEKEGYVERRQNLNDRRVVLVRFTGKGKEKLNTLHQNLTETLLKLTEALSNEELETLVNLHRKITDNVSPDL